MSEAMTIYSQEEKLFEEWRRHRKRFDPDGRFVSDGAVSENDYQTSNPKIAFILKEVNDENGGGWDLRECLRNGGRGQTWNNVTRWVHGMRSLPTRHEWSFYEEITEDFRKETLKNIVAMNLKKTPGGGSTDLQDLKTVATEDAPYIEKQYAIYDPDITICGGDDTGDFLRKALGHEMKWQTTVGNHGDKIRWCSRNADPGPKYVVAYWHPAARGRSNDFSLSNDFLLYNLLTVIAKINRLLHR